MCISAGKTKPCICPKGTIPSPQRYLLVVVTKAIACQHRWRSKFPRVQKLLAYAQQNMIHDLEAMYLISVPDNQPYVAKPDLDPIPRHIYIG